MAEIIFEAAARKKSKLRLAIMGPAGAGKTYSALDVMYGIVGDWGKIFVICTERGSASLYSNKVPAGRPKYRVYPMEPPYSPANFRKAIKAAESLGAEGIIIDSLSHAWEGDGGALDRVDAAASKSGNSFTAWKDVTPEHRAMVDAILQSPCHIIATLRSKQEYVLEPNDKGKMVPVRKGLAPIQRAGMEYEFTIFMDMDESHFATTTKDRTGLFDGKRFKPSVETGQEAKHWLEHEDQDVEPALRAPAEQAAAPQGEAPGSAVAAFKMYTDISNDIKNATDKQKLLAAWDKILANKAVLGADMEADLKAACNAKGKELGGQQ